MQKVQIKPKDPIISNRMVAFIPAKVYEVEQEALCGARWKLKGIWGWWPSTSFITIKEPANAENQTPLFA